MAVNNYATPKVFVVDKVWRATRLVHMARPLRIQFPGAYYHIMCRGNAKQQIFHSDEDRTRFVNLLSESMEMYSVRLHTYILMPNHYHILAQTLKPNCSEFMRRLNVKYAGWFNYRHNRCGHLYQGRYKAIVIEADSYLLEVSRYVHLNIIRSSLGSGTSLHRKWQDATSYRWSSLPGYLRKRKIQCFVYYDQILSIIGSRRYYEQFVADGIRYGIVNPFKDVRYGLLLGDDNFVKRMRAECIEEGSKSEQPSYHELVVENLEPQRVIECVAEIYGVKKQSILDYYGNSEIRGMASEFLYRFSAVTQAEIGQLLGGISYSGVSRLRHRLQRKLKSNQQTLAQYQEAETRLKKLSIVKI